MSPAPEASGPHCRAIAPDRFRALLSRHAASVAVVSTDAEPPVGFTATSFTSVSLHPPLVSFCIDRSSSSWSAVSSARYLGVHLLTRDQEHMARRFATSGIDRFGADVSWCPGPYGVAVLADCLIWLVCRVVNQIHAGDHAIVLAEPVIGDYLHGTREPLLYHMGQYLTTAPATVRR